MQLADDELISVLDVAQKKLEEVEEAIDSNTQVAEVSPGLWALVAAASTTLTAAMDACPTNSNVNGVGHSDDGGLEIFSSLVAAASSAVRTLL